MTRSRSLGQRVARQGVRLAGSGVVLDSMPERTFQIEHVVRGLRARKWVVWTVPRMHMTAAGLPDVIAYHPNVPGLVLCWELKREVNSRTSPAQRRAMAHLSTVTGIDARIVRPSTWPLLLRALDCPDPAAELARIEEGRV